MPKAVPAISRDLIEHLEEVYPNKLPEAVPSPSDMGELIGQQKVIRHLKAKFAEQEKGAMPKVL